MNIMNTPQQDYQAALDYIYSFVDFSRTHQENLSPENFDLSRMVRFMEHLGSPQKSFPAIHIAGSKGKGSVSAFCASALQAGGYKVGLYTSPHLKDFEERMQVNQVPIPRNILVEIVEDIKPSVMKVPELTTFEIMTGLAFLYFARAGVDIAVIEVGLGGRLDATNIITPKVSVITSLYLDHVTILGDTLEKIAAEKGGIIKQDIPVVCAPQEEGPLEVLKKIASEKKAVFIEVDQKYPYQILSKSLEGQVFRLEQKENPGDSQFRIPLAGDFQVINAVTAYGALDTLRSKGFPLDEAVIKKGFQDVHWPARFEVLRHEPPVIVDAAHNPASLGKLRDTIDEFFPGMPLILVFGISEDKQLDGMLAEILPRTTHLISTQADHPRAMDPENLIERARQYNCSTESIPDVAQALERALSLAGTDHLVVVTGSIFVAASGRIAWFDQN
ncbi:MAG: bifunctional folylpolyglutamate synthase/dihydrofolate synthase [Chloroflexi bacterium]|nr:bifunctional folylpolyglutamate synthase/dihydrofolate synthase [Chloroflexota bacterium]